MGDCRPRPASGPHPSLSLTNSVLFLLSPCDVCLSACLPLLSVSALSSFFLDLSQLWLCVFLCALFSPHVPGSLHSAPSFCLHFCFNPPAPLACLFIVFFFLTVKDLDTEKYFHLVSAPPAALGVPAPCWVWTWLPPAWASGGRAPGPGKGWGGEWECHPGSLGAPQSTRRARCLWVHG